MKEKVGGRQGFSVFDFFDYRRCLDEYYRHRKELNSRFSHRVFARMAGYRSSGLYIELVRGKANLTRKMIPGFIKAMGLGQFEAAYFEHMVQFTHARTAESRQHWFESMVPLMPPRNRVLAMDQKKYYEKWYNVAIREALSVLDVAEDTRELAQFMRPAITPAQATASLRILEGIGLIRKDAEGCWRATDAILESTPALGSLLIHPFQESLIDLGREALKRFGKEDRNVTCFTFSLSKMGYQRLGLKIDQFVQEVAHLVRSDEEMDRVCQFNIQFFPLTGRME